jgi:hypothetical protein
MKCFLCQRELPDLRRRRCNSCNTKIRRYRTKLAAVAYLGGKCIRCGYKENVAGLEFHHRDADEKEFTIANVANKAWDVIVKELDKCDLLCSTCHRVEHAKRDEAFIAEAMKYAYQANLVKADA